MLDEEIRKRVIDQAVKESLEKIQSYYSRDAICREVAQRVADKYLEQHMLDIIKSLDLDTIVRVTTLELVNRVVKQLRD